MLLVLVSGGIASALGAEDYHQNVRNLAADTPREKIQVAVKAIKDAGTNAFPVLLAHLQDKKRAEPLFFQGDSARAPTIGDACFDLLQWEIEGAWPKGFRDYYTLTPKNVRNWLAEHSGLSLQQLRVEAAQQSLARAVDDTPKKKDSEWHKKELEFLRRNLEEAKQNASQKGPLEKSGRN
jgi:hypothetical protein